MTTLRKRLRINAVALISLFIAVSSLAYSRWWTIGITTCRLMKILTRKAS